MPMVRVEIVDGNAGLLEDPQLVQLVALNVREVREEHPENADVPIEETPHGISREVN